MSANWTVHAVKYADRNTRIRGDSFIFDDDHASPHPMDYFVWLLRNGSRTILVDTGYDAAEGARRDRPILRDPVVALEPLGVRAEEIDTVIITHLHYDHAGGLDRYPSARFHLQAAEMAYATGPCMCHDTLRMPFTAEHVCEMVRHVYSGRVIFHDGDAEVAPGVTVHAIGGHSRGLQAVRVETANGPFCLASDATHFYENFLTGKPFPIVADLEPMLTGFDRITALAGTADRVIPGHDPLVTTLYPVDPNVPFAWRIDAGPQGPLPTFSRPET
ncbi:N-acyl homoserine lactonase family protein [Oceanomicrobium pacificus]|uniref:MBL fold metallo-hydrolase n=1 Tax=Oceanomicrobium pacificus TaxID=2692916 RepID=A0A6B0TPT0_9RHOB|nr:N-acyl homoserine lactonase family protein [Oceanomicrobium pacificus]MXU66627.1 MBL fold metallo-hydrolase [Oceanomicrobium pacificus]